MSRMYEDAARLVVASAGGASAPPLRQTAGGALWDGAVVSGVKVTVTRSDDAVMSEVPRSSAQHHRPATLAGAVVLPAHPPRGPHLPAPEREPRTDPPIPPAKAGITMARVDGLRYRIARSPSQSDRLDRRTPAKSTGAGSPGPRDPEMPVPQGTNRHHADRRTAKVTAALDAIL